MYRHTSSELHSSHPPQIDGWVIIIIIIVIVFIITIFIIVNIKIILSFIFLLYPLSHNMTSPPISIPSGVQREHLCTRAVFKMNNLRWILSPDGDIYCKVIKPSRSSALKCLSTQLLALNPWPLHRCTVKGSRKLLGHLVEKTLGR